ncbi:MAG: hypothetical protein JST42_29300 [Bacteroidetes bacterium]|nr:hypothetical protein [Bacteroidota bacterium]
MRVRNKFHGTNSAAIPGLVLVVGMGFVLFVLLKRIVWLRIERDRLMIRGLFFRQELALSEIREIRLLDRKTMFIGNTRYEALTIRAAGQKEFILYDVLYSNMPAMKACLQEWYKGVARPGYFQDRPVVKVSEPETFAGNFVFSQNGLFLLGWCVFMIWMMKTLWPLAARGWSELVVACSVVSLLGSPLLIIFGGQLYYFRIEGDELLIKSHVWFWYKRCYPLADIACAVIEKPYNRSTALRIRTRDFRSKSFGAGSLRKRHWEGLCQRLRQLQVPVVGGGYIGIPDEASADWRSED